MIRERSLYHHGVLGMKWGVRKYQNKDGSLTSRGKQRAQELSKDYKKEDFTLKKGSKFQRIGSKNEKDDSRRTYVSFEKDDNYRYIDYGASGWLGGPVASKITLKSINDVKVAKGKVLVDTFIETYSNKPISELVDAARPKQFNSSGKKETRDSKERRKELYKIYSNATKDKESFDKAYTKFQSSLMNDSKISSEYFNYLNKKGYNAMYDYNDREAANNPLIVFNRKNTLMTKKISNISQREHDDAIDYLKRKGLY